MKIAIGGEFKIDVSEGGHPIWCEISYDGKKICHINALELRDLEYAVKAARRQAAMVAEQMDPKRINHY